jgi:pimeloyl-ACP methyl ester carboxylesterase
MRFKKIVPLLFFLFITHFSVYASTLPSPSDVFLWAEQIAKSNKGLKEKIDALDDSYEIVFIPGILGSELTIGNFVYGKDKIKADKLVFDPKQRVEARTLNTFQAKFCWQTFKKIDIYGSGLDLLKSGCHGKAAKEFAYDWRADIQDSAEKFNKWAEQNIKGKNVVIVAHSMGGLVAWQWKNTYQENRPFNLIGLVLVGVPMEGSCEPAKMLVEGYSAPINSNVFEKLATELVFGKARPAIFTFPSVFQLLPKYNENAPCIKMKSPAGEELPHDHHLIDTWLGRPGGNYRLGKINDSERNEFFSQVGLDEKTYNDRVRKAIETGRRFRSDFDLNHKSKDDIHYLYSNIVDMAQHYTVVPDKKGWLAIDDKRELTIKGDGRVSKKSAINQDHADYKTRRIFLLHNKEHGELLSDPDFQEYISLEIDQLINNSIIKKILEYALLNPNLKKEIINRGWWPLDSSVQAKLLVLDPELRSASRIIAMYNAEQIPGEIRASAEGLIRYARSIKIDLDKQPENNEIIVASLIDSALLLDPDRVSYNDLYKLGKIRHKQERDVEAIPAYEIAIQKLLTPEGSSGFFTVAVTDTELKKVKLYTALGDAYERLGAKDAAFKARDDAKKITVALAKANLIGISIGTAVRVMSLADGTVVNMTYAQLTTLALQPGITLSATPVIMATQIAVPIPASLGGGFIVSEPVTLAAGLNAIEITTGATAAHVAGAMTETGPITAGASVAGAAGAGGVTAGSAAPFIAIAVIVALILLGL